MTSEYEKGILDYTGAVAAWLCAAHCVLLPLAAALLPLAGLSFLADEAAEWTLIGISAAIALASFLPAYFRRHRKMRAMLLFASGIGLIIFSHLLLEAPTVWKIPLIIAGAGFITAAHLFNRRLCRACAVC